MVYVKDLDKEKKALKVAKKLLNADIIFNYEERNLNKLPGGKKTPERMYSVILYTEEELVNEVYNAIKIKYEDLKIEKGKFSIEINITKENSVVDLL